MELKLDAFENYLNNLENSELIENKLFGVAIMENGDFTETHILEEDFNKYEHIDISVDVEKNVKFPIVTLK
jgi:hypothetical protein